MSRYKERSQTPELKDRATRSVGLVAFFSFSTVLLPILLCLATSHLLAAKRRAAWKLNSPHLLMTTMGEAWSSWSGNNIGVPRCATMGRAARAMKQGDTLRPGSAAAVGPADVVGISAQCPSGIVRHVAR